MAMTEELQLQLRTILESILVQKLYAKSLEQQLRAQKIRTQYMDPTDSLGKRIREGEKMKVPYLLVCGDREVEAQAVAVRNVATKAQATVPFQEFLSKTVEDIRGREAPGVDWIVISVQRAVISIC